MKKFLKNIRSNAKVHPPEAHIYDSSTLRPGQRYQGSNVGARLPTALLKRIFAYVCPHSQDESYDSAEESMIEDGCMLCDMRDLAHCALVCRAWNEVAQRLL